MISCMADDIVHEFKKFQFAKAMWQSLQELYGIISPTCHRAIQIKLGKLKCDGTNGIAKHLRVLRVSLPTLKAAGHPHTDKQKCLIGMNSLPNHHDCNQMRFSGILTFIIYKEVRYQVELEIQRLQEVAGDKSQSTVIIVQAKSTANHNMGAKEKAHLKKPNLGTENEGAIKKKKYHCPKKASKVDKSNGVCHNCEKLGHFACEYTSAKKVYYYNFATLVCS